MTTAPVIALVGISVVAYLLTVIVTRQKTIRDLLDDQEERVIEIEGLREELAEAISTTLTGKIHK